MRKVRDSPGALVFAVGAVMALMALIGALDDDGFSATVFASLAVALFVAGVVLRRRSGRPLALNMFLVGVIFAIFALIFSYTGDWGHVAGCTAIAITAWIATASTYKRSLRHRPGENHRTS
jgi:uncharacterized membrane protein YjjP (DUF1212 family)